MNRWRTHRFFPIKENSLLYAHSQTQPPTRRQPHRERGEWEKERGYLLLIRERKQKLWLNGANLLLTSVPHRRARGGRRKKNFQQNKTNKIIVKIWLRQEHRSEKVLVLVTNARTHSTWTWFCCVVMLRFFSYY